MDVLAVILACSFYPDDALVRTLVAVESSGNIYFVGDLKTLETNDSLTSAEAALRFADDVRRRGGRPAVGLMGVPLDWAARYSRAPIELFDACTNVAVATAALAEYHDRCARPPFSRRFKPHALHGRRPSGRSATSRNRQCVVSLFARDLGVVSAPAAILESLIEKRGTPAGDALDPPAHRSPVVSDEPPADIGQAATVKRPSIFLESRAIAPDDRTNAARRDRAPAR